MRALHLWVAAAGVACLLLARPCRGAETNWADFELRAIAAKVTHFKPVELSTGAGEVLLTAPQSLTVEDLRGVSLDTSPPLLRRPGKPYNPKMTDDLPAGEAPYAARGISSFRLHEFHCEFNYGGWHNWGLCDYAATHGFDTLSAYNRTPSECWHLPAGTRWLRWGGFVDWHKWLPEHGIPDGRYDRLVELNASAPPKADGAAEPPANRATNAGEEAGATAPPATALESQLLASDQFKADPDYQQLMIDMEHGRLAPEALRKQEWYPRDASADEREAFERRYYAGYALTYAAVARAARRAGWKNISVYGWEPFERTWFGLEKAQADPATDWAWNAFGKTIYDAVDILNPSLYCFYWSRQNVAYQLALIDLNKKLADSTGQDKPIRPYVWTLLHGGGGGWRWWANQPQPDEDVRAATTLGFFAGWDGFDCWNWSGTGNHHAPPPLAKDADVMLRDSFERAPDGAAAGTPPTPFRRYDVLHVLEVGTDGTVRFQRVEKENAAGNYGISEGKPVYTMPQADLALHLRRASEPVAAMVEGMALVKPFEYILSRGQVKVDVPAQEQFATTLPIVRRVKLGRIHLLATYDPMALESGQGREIALTDFDGHPGLTLKLPADAQIRLFVLKEK